MNADWKFLMHLFEIGRKRAKAQSGFWRITDRLGVETTFDLEPRFL